MKVLADPLPSRASSEGVLCEHGDTGSFLYGKAMMRIGLPVFLEYTQLLYHIIWPHGGDASDLMDNIKNRISCFQTGTEQVLVLNRYDDLSARDPERMRRAGEGSIT